MVRQAEATISPVSEHGWRIYLEAFLTTDSAFPFEAGQRVRIIVVPYRGIVVVPIDHEIDSDAITL